MFKKICFFILLSSWIMLVHANSSKIPMIIDTDMAIDDWLAILYLAHHPKVEIKAITVAGTGEAHCDEGVQNAKNLLQLAGLKPIPIACGPEKTLTGGHVYPKLWRHQADTLLNIKLAQANWPDSKLSVEKIWKDVLDTNPNTIMLTLGPLTNLAFVLENNQTILHKCKHIYMMGGAVNVEGNVKASAPSIENETAEWNFFIDSLAAKKIFSANLPITIVPIDVTNKVELNKQFIETFVKHAKSPSAKFVQQALEKFKEFVHPEGWFFWDPLAAAIAVDPELAVIEPMPIEILVEPFSQCGRTKISPDGQVINVATDADANSFRKSFIEVLNIEK